MIRISPILAMAIVCSAAAVPAQAQKSNRPRPSGVPAPAGQTAPADTSSAPKGRRATPTLVRPGAPAAAPAPAAAAPRASTRGAAAVTPQAAPAAGASFTAGLLIEPFDGDEAALVPYLRRFTVGLDSAVALLVSVFRNTSGQPLAGAASPTSLSARERDRWTRCRDLHWDLTSYVTAMHDLVEHENATVARAAVALDSALTALTATVECDNLASMIAAPGRWTPWEGNYTSSARNFYGSWYVQLRDVADRNRAFVVALNATVPAGSRLPVPPAMARTAPYAGASPR